jgi:predicted GNAT family N-acyltransferase
VDGSELEAEPAIMAAEPQVSVATASAEIEKCFAVRKEVFVVEQGVPESLERDDQDATATHVLAQLQGDPADPAAAAAVGAARLLVSGEGGSKTGKIGRVCVLLAYRKKGVGRAVVLGSVEELRRQGCAYAKLGAQKTAVGFYESMGFSRDPKGGPNHDGAEYIDGPEVPHIDMVMELLGGSDEAAEPAEEGEPAKLMVCICDRRDPQEDGCCVTCGGAIASANPLTSALSEEGEEEEAAPPPATAAADGVIVGEEEELTALLFSFGVVADVQYADLPVGTNFLKTVTRYYRHALDALALAVQSWLHDGAGPNGGAAPVAFVAQLGDLIDGKNADHGQTAAAAADIHGVLSRLGSIPVHSAIGNHEVMNFGRSHLHATASVLLSGPHLHELAGTEQQGEATAAAAAAAAAEGGGGGGCGYRKYSTRTL